MLTNIVRVMALAAPLTTTLLGAVTLVSRPLARNVRPLS